MFASHQCCSKLLGSRPALFVALPFVRFVCLSLFIAYPSLDITHLGLLGLLLSLQLGRIYKESAPSTCPLSASSLTLHLSLSLGLHLSLQGMRHSLFHLALLLGTQLGPRSARGQKTLARASCCIGLCDLVFGGLGSLASLLAGTGFARRQAVL